MHWWALTSSMIKQHIHKCDPFPDLFLYHGQRANCFCSPHDNYLWFIRRKCDGIYHDFYLFIIWRKTYAYKLYMNKQRNKSKKWKKKHKHLKNCFGELTSLARNEKPTKKRMARSTRCDAMPRTNSSQHSVNKKRDNRIRFLINQ